MGLAASFEEPDARLRFAETVSPPTIKTPLPYADTSALTTANSQAQKPFAPLFGVGRVGVKIERAYCWEFEEKIEGGSGRIAPTRRRRRMGRERKKSARQGAVTLPSTTTVLGISFSSHKKTQFRKQNILWFWFFLSS